MINVKRRDMPLAEPNPDNEIRRVRAGGSELITSKSNI